MRETERPRTLNRRTVLKQSGLIGGVAALGGLAGCLGSTRGGGGGGGGGGPTKSVTVEGQTLELDRDMTVGGSLPDAGELPGWHGAREVAPELFDDWAVTIRQMSGTDIIIQAMVSGELQGGTTGISGGAPLIERGKPLKAVISHAIGPGDYVLVTQPGIESYEDIVEQDAVLGMNSPVGLEVVMVVALLKDRGLIDSADEIELQQIGYSSARVGAMIKGDIDVSPQHYGQWLVLKEEKPELNNLGSINAELDADPVPNVYWTTPDELDRNFDSWVAYCASIVESARRITDDFQTFKDALVTYVPGSDIPENEDDFRQIYDFSVENGGWNLNGGISPEAQEFTLSVLHSVGITDRKLAPEEVFDRRPLDAALDIVGRV